MKPIFILIILLILIFLVICILYFKHVTKREYMLGGTIPNFAIIALQNTDRYSQSAYSPANSNPSFQNLTVTYTSPSLYTLTDFVTYSALFVGDSIGLGSATANITTIKSKLLPIDVNTTDVTNLGYKIVTQQDIPLVLPTQLYYSRPYNPYQVIIGLFTDNVIGPRGIGTLVAKNMVITVAHNVEGLDQTLKNLSFSFQSADKSINRRYRDYYKVKNNSDTSMYIYYNPDNTSQYISARSANKDPGWYKMDFALIPADRYQFPKREKPEPKKCGQINVDYDLALIVLKTPVNLTGQPVPQIVPSTDVGRTIHTKLHNDITNIEIDGAILREDVLTQTPILPYTSSAKLVNYSSIDMELKTANTLYFTRALSQEDCINGSIGQYPCTVYFRILWNIGFLSEDDDDVENIKQYVGIGTDTNGIFVGFLGKEFGVIVGSAEGLNMVFTNPFNPVEWNYYYFVINSNSVSCFLGEALTNRTKLWSAMGNPVTFSNGLLENKFQAKIISPNRTSLRMQIACKKIFMNKGNFYTNGFFQVSDPDAFVAAYGRKPGTPMVSYSGSGNFPNNVMTYNSTELSTVSFQASPFIQEYETSGPLSIPMTIPGDSGGSIYYIDPDGNKYIVGVHAMGDIVTNWLTGYKASRGIDLFLFSPWIAEMIREYS